MSKRLILFVGVIIGFLLAEIFRRPKIARLQTFEAEEANRQKLNTQYKEEWQREVANMPFDERMDWELFEAGLKLDGYIKDGDDE